MKNNLFSVEILRGANCGRAKPADFLLLAVAEILAELYRKIYKTEMKFRTILGSWGCREKNSQLP